MAWAFLLGHFLVVDILAEEATFGDAPRVQGTRVIGDEGPMKLWDLHRDGVSAVSGRGPVNVAPEEREYFLRQVARAAVGRLVDDVGKGERTPGVALLRALADRDLQGDLVEPPGTRPDGCGRNPAAACPRRGKPPT